MSSNIGYHCPNCRALETYGDIESCTDVERLVDKLVKAGATRQKIIWEIDKFGDGVDWEEYTLGEIIGTVWDSDLNSGDPSPDEWIINHICREFGVEEVS